MKIAVDLHIHSALSPCGDDDMTPNNIVNMCKLKKLDAIALTDHNSSLNVEAVKRLGDKNDLCVIPGMEVQTKEEVHLICLFPDMQSINEFQVIIDRNLPDIENKENIFGRQLLFDEQDNIIASYKKLLLTSTVLTIGEVYEYVYRLGGVTIPAHIDRYGFSLLTNLGFIPESPEFTTLELSKNVDFLTFKKQNPFIKKYRTIISSDAHYLWDILERQTIIDVYKNKPVDIINLLKSNKNLNI
ncbi:MAG: PHP domain-containing protein [Clostridia bacterium]|nr:PHP domain-containing protein [Clostridia bacterium]